MTKTNDYAKMYDIGYCCQRVKANVHPSVSGKKHHKRVVGLYY